MEASYTYVHKFFFWVTHAFVRSTYRSQQPTNLNLWIGNYVNVHVSLLFQNFRMYYRLGWAYAILTPGTREYTKYDI